MLAQDNLNTHKPAPLYEAFPAGAQILRGVVLVPVPAAIAEIMPQTKGWKRQPCAEEGVLGRWGAARIIETPG